LIATTFARDDFKTGTMLCQLISKHNRSGSDYDRMLWTALGVIYARPFLPSNDVGQVSERTFERFDDEGQESLHRVLKRARHTTYAHTGIHEALSVHVTPPGAFHEIGNASVGRIDFNPALVPDIAALCDLQAERAAGVISKLVGRLYGYRKWAEGTQFQLDFPAIEFEPARER
jgi:hypothetical protein